MIPDNILDCLLDKGLISTLDVSVTPLTGGVSSDIWLVDDGDTRFVVKRALPQLRVKDRWSADPERNRYEQAYMRYAGGLQPHNVPRILHSDSDLGFFTMEYLGDGWLNWKQELLAGRVDGRVAHRAGEFLSAVHSASWGDGDLASQFDSTMLFYQLRIEPYLLTTGRRAPELSDHFEDEAVRLASDRVALVHGDYSPKNVLTRDGNIRVLDCEVACFADPAFDVSFLLNHLLLKSVQLPECLSGYMDLASGFLDAYSAGLRSRFDPDLERRTLRLLLMLLLARVVGKSPAEYLVDDPGKVDLISTFVHTHLPDPPDRFEQFVTVWRDYLHRALA